MIEWMALSLAFWGIKWQDRKHELCLRVIRNARQPEKCLSLWQRLAPPRNYRVAQDIDYPIISPANTWKCSITGGKMSFIHYSVIDPYVNVMQGLNKHNLQRKL